MIVQQVQFLPRSALTQHGRLEVLETPFMRSAAPARVLWRAITLVALALGAVLTRRHCAAWASPAALSADTGCTFIPSYFRAVH